MTEQSEQNGDRIPCPTCGEQIAVAAKKCRYCGAWLDPSAAPQSEKPIKHRTLFETWQAVPVWARGMIAAVPIAFLLFKVGENANIDSYWIVVAYMTTYLAVTLANVSKASTLAEFFFVFLLGCFSLYLIIELPKEMYALSGAINDQGRNRMMIFPGAIQPTLAAMYFVTLPVKSKFGLIKLTGILLIYSVCWFMTLSVYKELDGILVNLLIFIGIVVGYTTNRVAQKLAAKWGDNNLEK